MMTQLNNNKECPIIFTIPSLGWKVIDTLQGACFEYEDGSHDWPTPRERLIIEAFQRYVNTNTASNPTSNEWEVREGEEMKHTQEQLAAVLNNQYQRGSQDAELRRAYGHSDESTSYPNHAWPDITRQAASDAYKDGWARKRVQMGKPDAICAERLGKGVRH